MVAASFGSRWELQKWNTGNVRVGDGTSCVLLGGNAMLTGGGVTMCVVVSQKHPRADVTMSPTFSQSFTPSKGGRSLLNRLSPELGG